MNCLDCPACAQRFEQSGGATPRVLVVCGHTFCQLCIQQRMQAGVVSCFVCLKVSRISEEGSVQDFPVNQTLLSMVRRENQSQQQLCRTHRKRLQAYCEKDKEPICVQCTLSTHRLHKACLLSEKALVDRVLLKDCGVRIEQGLRENRELLQKFVFEQSSIEKSFLDYQMEVNIFFKNVLQELGNLQNREIERTRREKEEFLHKITGYRNEIAEKVQFFSQLQSMYCQIASMGDISFLKESTKRAFIVQNCRNKKSRYPPAVIEFKRVGCLQEIVGSLQEMIGFEKKRSMHSGSSQLGSSHNSSGTVKASPSVKKGKEPAVLEVNLSEEYNKRRANLINQAKKIKPVKKVINMVAEGERVGEAVGLGRPASNPAKEKGELKYIRESSIKKSKEVDVSLSASLTFTDNYAPFSSFLRSSRSSEVQQTFINEPSIKNAFDDFTLLDLQERVYHFGGRVPLQAQRYDEQACVSEKIPAAFHKKGAQCVYFKHYSKQKCLIVGGTSCSNLQAQDLGTEVYEFSFKTQKLSKTGMHVSQGRSGFGCVVREDSFYLIGGRQQQKYFNTFERYTYDSGKLSLVCMPSMRQARGDLGFCLGYDGYLYLAGGINLAKSILRSCERFNWESNLWEPVADMKHQRRGFAMVAVPQGLFVIGGHDTVRMLSEVEFYDFGRKEWVECAPMKEARCYHTAVVAKDYQSITVFGGFNNLSDLASIESYSIEGDNWKVKGSMGRQRCLHCSVSSPF